MAHPGSAYSQYSFALLVLVPLLGGVIQALSLRGMYTSSGERAIYSLFNTIVSCIGAAIFLREGAVCLVMAFPLLWLMYYVGVTIGCLIFERGPRPLQVSVVPMVLFAMVWDVTHPTVYSGMTTTRLRVNASPSAVGKYIVAFPKIDTPPTFWLCYFGLPYPEQTTAERPTVGAKRECWLSGNLVVREKITEYSPGRSVTFTVTEQPRDPEIAGHFDLQQGRITVADNGDGTSTLIGTSWYRLRVAPSWYFGPWADHLIHSVHERVFQHINRLAERDTPAVIR